MGEVLQLDLAAVFKPYRKQAEFLLSRARNRFFLAGRGAGKSWTLTLDALLQALANPGAPGALLGRTEPDLKKNLLPFLKVHLDALRQATGFNWVKRYSAADQQIELHNGSTIHWRGYERVDKLRGQNLAWVNADEICWSEADELTVYETLVTTIRIPCARPSFAIASSPNGLRGVVKLFRDRQLAADPGFYVARASSYDNPYLAHSTIKAWESAMGTRRRDQEIYALALRPLSAVFAEFRESRHVVPWQYQAHQGGARWVFGVDWGLNRAVALAIQVTAEGRWVVVDELVRQPESRGHFRAELRAWIDKLTGGDPPFLISADRAVKEENAWLMQVYGARRARVLSLSTKHDQYVRTGLTAMGDMLAPTTGDPRLVFAASLRRMYEGEVAGIVPSMQAYRYQLDRDSNPTDTPAKDNVHDHAVDALRYAVVAGQRFRELHAGRLPNRWTTGPDGLPMDGKDGDHVAHY